MDCSDYRNKLIAAAEKYSMATGRSRAFAAKSVANDGKFFDRIEQGGGCTVDTFQKFIEWFKKNTPSNKNN